MGEDGSTPALSRRDPTWPPPGPAQAQLLKHYRARKWLSTIIKYELYQEEQTWPYSDTSVLLHADFESLDYDQIVLQYSDVQILIN